MKKHYGKQEGGYDPIGKKGDIYKRIKELILDSIFPDRIYCISCGNLIEKSFSFGICGECMEKISWIKGSTCIRCGKEVEYEGITCTDCRTKEDTSIDKGFLCTVYKDIEKRIIHGLKYGNKPFLAKNIAEIMYAKIKNEKPDINGIISVPMYEKKEKLRGYNQADLIAEELAKITGMDNIKGLLIRNSDTKPMAKLTAEERKRNVENAFSVVINDKITKFKMDELKLLLIDDVYTTGSTAEACAYALKNAGVSKVYYCGFSSAKIGYVGSSGL